MAAVIAQVTIPFKTGLPADVSVNVWSFEIVSDDESNFQEVSDFLFAFYSDCVPYLSPTLDLNAFQVKCYLRADPEPRVPQFEEVRALPGSSGNTPIPEECAVCLSFKGVPVSGTSAARRRGRVYIGPLATTAITEAVDEHTLVNGAFLTAMETGITDAYAQLTTAGNSHTVWSTVNSNNVVIDSYWVDNAFDTQRRRGVRATSRITFDSP